MKAYWWRDEPNFGDQLATLFLKDPVWVPPEVEGKVLSIGSVLHCLRRGDTVWGTGVQWEASFPMPEGVRILALRGPHSAWKLGYRGDVPFGDPGLLLPRWHRVTGVAGPAVGWVPHMIDPRSAGEVFPDCAELRGREVIRVDLRRPWPEVVKEILRCKVIVTSSLHGIVCAEAYGLQAMWIPYDQVLGRRLKFEDYVLGTGRPASALVAGEFLPPIPNLRKLQDDLAAAGRDVFD